MLLIVVVTLLKRQTVIQSSSKLCVPLTCVSTHADGVDVGLVAGEGLPTHAVPDVPQLDGGVAGARHKGAEVGR